MLVCCHPAIRSKWILKNKKSINYDSYDLYRIVILLYSVVMQAVPQENLPTSDPIAERHMYDNYIKSYGKGSKPRYEDPSMFEMMQWREAEKDHQFKSSKDALREMDDYKRYKALIDKSGDGFTTEAMDNYKNFVYKKVGDDHQKIPFESTFRSSHDKSMPKQSVHIPTVSANPNYRSEYVDEMTNKLNQDTYDRISRTLQLNEIERREKSRSRDRRPYSGNYKRNDLLDWPEGEELKRIKEEEQAQKEAEEALLNQQRALLLAKQQEEEVSYN